jgi:DEAD/DEAH box helicase domain-containing protein
MELTNDRGQVLADAELSWMGEKLTVLRADQEDLAEEWKAAGWTVELLDDAGTSIQGKPWQEPIAERLGLKLNKSEE